MNNYDIYVPLLVSLYNDDCLILETIVKDFVELGWAGRLPNGAPIIPDKGKEIAREELRRMIRHLLIGGSPDSYKSFAWGCLMDSGYITYNYGVTLEGRLFLAKQTTDI